MHTVEEELFTEINVKLLSFASFRIETNLNSLEDVVTMYTSFLRNCVLSTECGSIYAFSSIIAAKNYCSPDQS
jgi:hypothetical protein